MVKLENEISENLREGFARIFTVIALDSNANIVSVSTYPTLEMVEKSNENWEEFCNKNSITQPEKLIRKVYAGSVFYAGETEYNRLVRY